MPSRYTPKQKTKNPFIKWSLIIGSILVVAAAAAWFYLKTIDSPANIDGAAKNEVQTSQSPAEGKPEGDEPVEETEAPEQTEDPKQEEPQGQPEETETQEKPASESEPKEQEQAKDAAVYSEAVKLPKEPTVINGILLANKQHPLPETYAPGEGKEARAAFEKMREKALQEEIDLVAFSTYRDFSRQKELYNGYVAKDGQEAADRYSARPGYSEHQTGLAFDIGEAGQEQHWASASFGETKGGKWLAENAHNYGFILRYPEGSESITGYMHESWHFRYVGKKAATEIHKNGITLEQYLGV
ncbi:D-alanyl-D-alanine carboxypeptidase family protein [Planomicrobium sp. CPCC 101079]|uniref:D-alanyl-D-alanine carboxypeptidase family protein n=1 Tax=Planomicrobium sp. CPCC 101079 TaxID=2599618 RepID=UPI0011B5DD3A|nr:D-alanyl-D-alanine carboxypeptidase family protein [Planomicrobium sp. CPCC 101079]TWT02227.1 D-alanyl-D-alanine carboxypeptidase [Planomicrobium sp. CPCC 101079]